MHLWLVICLLGVGVVRVTSHSENTEGTIDDIIHINQGLIPKDHPQWSALFEGDILLTSTTFSPDIRKWPMKDGLVTIPYTLDSTYLPEHVAVILEAFDVLQKTTCVRFISRTEERDFISIKPVEGCYSTLGRRGKMQVTSLSLDCLARGKGVVLHELMHVLGFWHEHSRSDRDQYIRINSDAIIPGFKQNFCKYDTTNMITPYTFTSIMHYSRYAFAKAGQQSIVPLVPNVEIGQRMKLDEEDIKRVNKLYSCPQYITSRDESEVLVGNSPPVIYNCDSDYTEEEQTYTSNESLTNISISPQVNNVSTISPSAINKPELNPVTDSSAISEPQTSATIDSSSTYEPKHKTVTNYSDIHEPEPKVATNYSTTEHIAATRSSAILQPENSSTTNTSDIHEPLLKVSTSPFTIQKHEHKSISPPETEHEVATGFFDIFEPEHKAVSSSLGLHEFGQKIPNGSSARHDPVNADANPSATHEPKHKVTISPSAMHEPKHNAAPSSSSIYEAMYNYTRASVVQEPRYVAVTGLSAFHELQPSPATNAAYTHTLKSAQLSQPSSVSASPFTIRKHEQKSISPPAIHEPEHEVATSFFDIFEPEHKAVTSSSDLLESEHKSQNGSSARHEPANTDDNPSATHESKRTGTTSSAMHESEQNSAPSSTSIYEPVHNSTSASVVQEPQYDAVTGLSAFHELQHTTATNVSSTDTFKSGQLKLSTGPFAIQKPEHKSISPTTIHEPEHEVATSFFDNFEPEHKVTDSSVIYEPQASATIGSSSIYEVKHKTVTDSSDLHEPEPKVATDYSTTKSEHIAATRSAILQPEHSRTTNMSDILKPLLKVFTSPFAIQKHEHKSISPPAIHEPEHEVATSFFDIFEPEHKAVSSSLGLHEFEHTIQHGSSVRHDTVNADANPSATHEPKHNVTISPSAMHEPKSNAAPSSTSIYEPVHNSNRASVIQEPQYDAVTGFFAFHELQPSPATNALSTHIFKSAQLKVSTSPFAIHKHGYKSISPPAIHEPKQEMATSFFDIFEPEHKAVSSSFGLHESRHKIQNGSSARYDPVNTDANPYATNEPKNKVTTSPSAMHDAEQNAAPSPSSIYEPVYNSTSVSAIQEPQFNALTGLSAFHERQPSPATNASSTHTLKSAKLSQPSSVSASPFAIRKPEQKSISPPAIYEPEHEVATSFFDIIFDIFEPEHKAVRSSLDLHESGHKIQNCSSARHEPVNVDANPSATHEPKHKVTTSPSAVHKPKHNAVPNSSSIYEPVHNSTSASAFHELQPSPATNAASTHTLKSGEPKSGLLKNVVKRALPDLKRTTVFGEKLQQKKSLLKALFKMPHFDRPHVLIIKHDSLCGFDHGMCGWRQSMDDDLDWTLSRGSVNLYNGHFKAKGFHLSLKSNQSATVTGEKAILARLITWPSNCITFWYGSRHSIMGSLNIYLISDIGEQTLLWSAERQENVTWTRAQIFWPLLALYNGQVVVEGVVGPTDASQIVIDNLYVGKCF